MTINGASLATAPLLINAGNSAQIINDLNNGRDPNHQKIVVNFLDEIWEKVGSNPCGAFLAIGWSICVGQHTDNNEETLALFEEVSAAILGDTLAHTQACDMVFHLTQFAMENS